jgi:hypothetical protein
MAGSMVRNSTGAFISFLAGVVLVLFGCENTGTLCRHVCFREDRIVGDSPSRL